MLDCSYRTVESMQRFVWDAKKNRRNRAKHKVSFETAALVFDDPKALTLYDRTEGGEERWHTMGSAGGSVVLLVVHTDYQEGDDIVIRLTSARRATPRERK